MTTGGIGSSQALRIAEGSQYLEYDDLQPFDPPANEALLQEVLKGLGADADWNAQFQAIDDMRRLARHAPRLVASDRARLRKVVSLVVALADSLRSALAKNALRCIAELFAALGSRMDPDLDPVLSALLRRAADTNAFISEEADVSLREACRLAGSDARLLVPVQATLSHRRPELRARAVWCLAMLAQRLRNAATASPGSHRTDEQLRVVAEAAAKTLTDANPDVRLAARLAALALSGAPGLEELPVAAKLQSAAAASGIDPQAFDAFDLDACRPFAGGGGRSGSIGGAGFSSSVSAGGARTRSALQGRA